MSQLIENPRLCPVCKAEVTDALTASYLEHKGLSVVFHDRCLASLDETIAERANPTRKPVHKAEVTGLIDDELTNAKIDVIIRVADMYKELRGE